MQQNKKLKKELCCQCSVYQKMVIKNIGHIKDDDISTARIKPPLKVINIY